MKKTISGVLAAVVLSAPMLAFASFNESVSVGQAQVNSLTSPQLDGLNAHVFSDAFLTAKILGYDPATIQEMKNDIRQLQDDNAQLRAQLNARSSSPVAAAPLNTSLDARVSALESKMSGLDDTLRVVVTLLTSLLAKMH
jgi:hypothetical protein